MSGIFISYRRSASQHFARSIYNALRQHGHDVFFDINSIDNGPFDQVILNQIAARPHFLLVLSKGSLERCINTGDWLRLEIEEAFRLNRNIVPIYDEGFDINSEKQFLPEPIRSKLPLINSPRYFHDYFDEFVQRINDRFLKQVIDPSTVIPTPATEGAEVQKHIEQAARPNDDSIMDKDLPTKSLPPAQPGDLGYVLRRSRSAQPLIWGVENILPQPFEWVYIPPGNVTINNQTFSVDVFNIAKYPITNAQFEVFVQAEDGYQKADWWEFSDKAGYWHEMNNLPKPRAFPDDDHPRVNVNYFEALAFCNWLKNRFNIPAENFSSMKITLPTERQWHRAAFSDGNSEFPWGNDLDFQRFNVWESRIARTTPVTQYLTGASIYGVMDMVGNVSEWCFGSDRKYSPASGSSWSHTYTLSSNFNVEKPILQTNFRGFRIVMMN